MDMLSSVGLNFLQQHSSAIMFVLADLNHIIVSGVGSIIQDEPR